MDQILVTVVLGVLIVAIFVAFFVSKARGRKNNG